MINTLIKSKSQCCGCGACASACPASCITMCADGEGFLYPQVDESKCLKCNKCFAFCPSLTKLEYNAPKQSYAVFAKDELIRQNSSSGGVFSVIANKVLDNGGVVCGASYCDDWSVKHIIIDSAEDLQKLRTSKYVQSEIYTVLNNVKDIVLSGRQVLFTGTPCQVNALATFLGKDYPNLYLADIICHGAPSPMVWRKYLATNVKGDIKSVNFRDKSFGWAKFATKIDFANGSYLKWFKEDLYMQFFLLNLILRPSCYNCFSKHPNKLADITLGDFWGIDKVLPDANDDKGISAVIVSSAKGSALFDSVAHQIVAHQVDFDSIAQGNSALYSSVKEPEKRGECMVQIASQEKPDFQKIMKKATVPPFSRRLINKVKRTIGMK